MLDAHAAGKVASRLLGAIADVLGAFEGASADLPRRVTDAARGGPGQDVADVVAWEGREYALRIHEESAKRAAVEVYQVRAQGGPRPVALLTLLLGEAGTKQLAGEDLGWLDAASEERLAPRLAPARASGAYREDVAQTLRPPELRQALAQLRQAPRLVQQPLREGDILEFAGLARKQFVLVCAKAPDPPLFTLDDEARLRLLLDAQARCPRCDEVFADANVRLLYSLTETGAEASAEPVWMLLPALGELGRLGARVRPLPVTRSGAPLGGVVFCGGLVLALQAYDRDVVPDDAVRLAAAAREVDADRIVVLTLGTVTADARKRLAELAPVGAPGEPPRVDLFERFTPSEPAALVAWWQALEADRLFRLLAGDALAGLRRLGLEPAALADAVARRPRAGRDVAVTEAPTARAKAVTS